VFRWGLQTKFPVCVGILFQNNEGKNVFSSGMPIHCKHSPSEIDLKFLSFDSCIFCVVFFSLFSKRIQHVYVELLFILFSF
jgi:hypothetical protein